MVVALNVELTRSEALRVAIMAQDGLARAVRPSHCPNDGDTLFVLCTGEKNLKRRHCNTLQIGNDGRRLYCKIDCQGCL
ncbi:MAG: hypothetical protein CM15mP45_02600 [Deltaproteobacteria bacterium]|nr:MAG: hypothetical protein CM15mP45_02600 [Deltaproteobacteria bacterium]